MALASNEKLSALTLEGRVAIITGASRGIGVGLAEELARRGAKVIMKWDYQRWDDGLPRLLGRNHLHLREKRTGCAGACQTAEVPQPLLGCHCGACRPSERGFSHADCRRSSGSIRSGN